MKAYELVRSVINKKLVPEKEGRGRKGYGNLRRVRLLIYQMLTGIRKDNYSELLEEVFKSDGLGGGAISKFIFKDLPSKVFIFQPTAVSKERPGKP